MAGVTQERMAGVAGTSPIRETRETVLSTTAGMSERANYDETPHLNRREESRGGKEGGKKGVSFSGWSEEAFREERKGGKKRREAKSPAGDGDDAGDNKHITAISR